MTSSTGNKNNRHSKRLWRRGTGDVSLSGLNAPPRTAKIVTFSIRGSFGWLIFHTADKHETNKASVAATAATQAAMAATIVQFTGLSSRGLPFM